MIRRFLPLMVLALSACGTPQLPIHKIDVYQGNYVDQEMVSKLKPGMTKSQVRYVLGTPLVTDAFHADRWDYIYRHQKGGKLLEQRQLAVIFEDERLKYVKGDVVVAADAGTPAVAEQAKEEGAGAAKPAEKSLLDSVLEKIGF